MHLGIDLGTSELKALLLDDDQRIVATASATLSVSRPKPLWAEQHPHDWWKALDTVMQTLQEKAPDALKQVRDMGLSGQMHGAVLLDERGDVLRPAILWNDGRSSSQCAVLQQSPELTQLTCNLAMPGFTAPKLMWIASHEPEIMARIHKVLLPKDWLRWKLSGRYCSDMSDASGTLWLNVKQRAWSEEMMALTKMTRAQMPDLVEGSACSACLRSDLARRWGIRHEVLIAGGAGDNAASAVGIGAIQPGQGFISLGTSGVIFLTTDHVEPCPEKAVHTFCHALPDRWHQMSVMLSAASAVSWATQTLGFANISALLSAAASCHSKERAQAPIFLPYLSGERSPHNDAHAQGVLFGLTASHSQTDLAYAVVEGVCLGLRDGLASLQAPTNPLVLAGGGAQSAWWCQLLSDVLQVPLISVSGGNIGGALGAARLGWLANGGTLSLACPMPDIQHTYVPDDHAQPLFAARWERFRNLYPALRPLFP